MKYKLIVSDIDGVWTDGSFYYTSEGDSLRKFSTKDSFGVALAAIAGISILILSGEENKMVKARLQKLGLTNFALGVKDKFSTIADFCESTNIKPSEVAFLGDDMNDYHLLGRLGLFACPADAYYKIRQKADLVLSSKGGKGAFREFVERLLKDEGMLDATYEKYVVQK